MTLLFEWVYTALPSLSLQISDGKIQIKFKQRESQAAGWLISRESRHGGCDPTCSVGGAPSHPLLLPPSTSPSYSPPRLGPSSSYISQLQSSPTLRLCPASHPTCPACSPRPPRPPSCSFCQVSLSSSPLSPSRFNVEEEKIHIFFTYSFGPPTSLAASI